MGVFDDLGNAMRLPAEAFGNAFGFGPESYAMKSRARGAWDQQQGRNARFDALYGQYQAGGFDPAVANRYYGSMAGQINTGANQASMGSAADYARRGLGNSGFSSAAQTGIAGNRTAALAEAQRQAQTQATADRRQQLAGSLSAAEAGSGAGQSMLGLAAQQAAAVDQQRMAAMQSYFQLLGMGMGAGVNAGMPLRGMGGMGMAAGSAAPQEPPWVPPPGYFGGPNGNGPVLM